VFSPISPTPKKHGVVGNVKAGLYTIDKDLLYPSAWLWVGNNFTWGWLQKFGIDTVFNFGG